MDRRERRKNRPSAGQLKSEYQRESRRNRLLESLRSISITMIVVASTAVLVAVLLTPVLRIYGTSMTPTLTEGEIVVTLKGKQVERGDILGVYYGSKLLIKRCIATAGQWVDIDDEGYVYVDNEKLEEPYVYERSVGECNIELPYQVPENTIFVMGDHRLTSIDSRHSSVGCIPHENVAGRILFRIWPLSKIGKVE